MANDFLLQNFAIAQVYRVFCREWKNRTEQGEKTHLKLKHVNRRMALCVYALCSALIVILL